MRWLALIVLLALPACSSDGQGDELLVLAASSLTEAFAEVEAAFEAQHPDVDVVLTFDGSATLAQQVADGAPAGVLATADPTTMEIATESGEVDGQPEAFVANTAVLARPAGNDTVRTPEDLEGDDVVLAVCAPEVPCGIVARDLFESLGIGPEIDSEEENVAAVVTKLESDEVDAGVVYETDVLAADRVEVVPTDESPVTEYPIVNVDGSDAAQAFVDFVTGSEGQAILADHGFVPLPDP